MAGGEGVSIAGPSSVCLVRGRACLGVCTFSLCSSGVGVCVRFLSFALLMFAQRCKRPKYYLCSFPLQSIVAILFPHKNVEPSGSKCARPQGRYTPVGSSFAVALAGGK